MKSLVSGQSIGPYKSLQLVHTGRRHTIFRTCNGTPDQAVILKVIFTPSTSQVTEVYNEFQLLRTLDIAGVPKALAVERDSKCIALVMSDAGFEPLRARMSRGPMELNEFFELARNLTQVLNEIHDSGVIHRNLCPENIVIDSKSGLPSFVDFSASRDIQRSETTHIALVRPAIHDGDLRYISPEQTGRMNRGEDHRSDLYSLGVIFYELITGRPPFALHDPLEQTHAHLSRMVVPPHKFNPAVPRSLSKLLVRLLAKAPEDRYQCAASLNYDLNYLQEHLSECGRLAFVPGSKDRSSPLATPIKLYGRANEVKLLGRAFEHMVSEKTAQLLLVSGYSGIGKTSLVRSLYEPLVRERGFCLAGKFDQVSRDIPFSTVVSAFQQLVRYLLTESEEQISYWKRLLEESLGPGLALIARVLPQIELLVGKQEPLPQLPADEEVVRFRSVFRQFIGVFARPEHPLVLFLDDLQWADPDSLQLIKTLIAAGKDLSLLLIGSYRENEIDSDHLLRHLINDIKASGAPIQSIVLKPLSEKHLNALVSDVLGCPKKISEPLSLLIHEKTHGNPFFAIQFLQMLYFEQLLQYDDEKEEWTWDLTQVKALKYADNIVDLFVARLRKLPAAAREVMINAAFLGNVGLLCNLSFVDGKSEKETINDLSAAVDAGLILIQQGEYKFLHDRVQQATYELIPKELSSARHLSIGRSLLSQYEEVGRGDNVFDILSQYNLGASCVEERSERLVLAQLNLRAGKKAKGNTAYVSAIQYFSAGLSILNEDDRREHHSLFFDLKFSLSQCSWLVGEFDCALAQYQQLLPLCETRLEQSNVYRMLAEISASKSVLLDSINYCLKGVSLLGIQLPVDVSREEALREYDLVWENLGNRTITELTELPVMTDPEMLVAIDILQALYSAAMIYDRNLFLLVGCKIVTLSLQYGNCNGSVLGYSQFGSTLPRLFGKYEQARYFAEVSRKLVEERGLNGYQARMEFLLSLIAFWTEGLQDSYQVLNRALQTARKASDAIFASICCGHLLVNAFYLGIPLSEIVQPPSINRPYWIDNGIDSPFEAYRTIKRAVSPLIDTNSQWNYSEKEEEEYSSKLEDGNIILAGLYHIIVLQTHFISGRYEMAVESGKKALPLLWAHITFCGECEYWYYYALALAARYDSVSDAEKKQYLETLAVHEKQLEEWAQDGPDYFENKYALVSAEIHRLKGDDTKAQQLYERAISSAHQRGYLHNEAIANELAGRFYLERGYQTAATAYLQEASACYSRWGANAKVVQMTRSYPQLQRTESKSWSLDLMTVFKAAQAISKEVVLDRLLETLMRVVVEAAGAQRCVLMLQTDDELVVRAYLDDFVHGTGDNTITEAKCASIVEMPVSAFSRLPISMVNYVRRTQETVVVGDTRRDTLFSNDAYFQQERSCSALCLSIVKQSKLVGVLYLENKLALHVFTPERIDFLQLLSGQIVTSLENVMLFEALRKSESQVRQMFQTAAVGHGSMDCATRKLIMVNAKLSEITGYSEEELLGLPISELTHPDDREEDFEKFQRFLNSNESEYATEKRYMRKDGETIWVQVNVAAMRDANGRAIMTAGIVQDITARIQAEQDLIRSEELFRWMVLEVTDYSILMLDKRGNIQSWNTGAERISGYRQEEILGKNFSDLFDKSSEKLYRPEERLQLAIDSGRHEGTVWLKRSDGARFWVSIILMASYDSSNQLKGFTFLTRDLTEQVRSAEEREELAVMKEREDFMAALTHDLKNPLLGANRILELFTAGSLGALTDQQLTILRKLKDSNKSLIEMLRNLVEVYRLQRDVNLLTFEIVDLAAIMDECLAEISPVCANRSICLRFEKSDDAVIEADGSFIRRVLQNILDNALKFTNNNGAITVALKRMSDFIEISISDTGPGLTEEERERLFQRFWQGVAGQRYVPGTGLGLHVCKEVVQAHDGKISCQSELGNGTTVIIELPLQQGTNPRGKAKAAIQRQ